MINVLGRTQVNVEMQGQSAQAGSPHTSTLTVIYPSFTSKRCLITVVAR
jgi:hypothetical protein